MKTNFPLGGLTITEVEHQIEHGIKVNKELQDLSERNQMNFVVKFFSEPLINQKTGLFLEGARFRDLITLYFIDYYLKQKLVDKALKIERYLNVIILTLHKENKIKKRTSDWQNSFGEVVNFFEDLETNDQKAIIKRFNQVHSTDFDLGNFVSCLDQIVDLRNFALHHYSIVSYSYASKIQNGKRHTEKDGKDTTLEAVIATLALFLNSNNAQDLLKEFKKTIKKFPFSSSKIKKIVTNKLTEILNFNALQKVNRKNAHFSLINFILKKS